MSIWIGAGGRFRRKLVLSGECRLHVRHLNRPPPLRAAVPAITERCLRQRFLPQWVERSAYFSFLVRIVMAISCFPWDSGGQKRLPGLKVPRRRSFCIVPCSFRPGLCRDSRRPLCLSCFFYRYDAVKRAVFDFHGSFMVCECRIKFPADRQIAFQRIAVSVQ